MPAAHTITHLVFETVKVGFRGDPFASSRQEQKQTKLSPWWWWVLPQFHVVMFDCNGFIQTQSRELHSENTDTSFHRMPIST